MSEGFTTVFTPGEKWEKEKKLTQQAGWEKNLAYWHKQHLEAGLEMRVLATDEKVHLGFWPKGTKDEVEVLAAGTPLVQSGVLEAKTEAGKPDL